MVLSDGQPNLDLESSTLLKDMIQLWTTIRGYSIAAQFMEDYKQATKAEYIVISYPSYISISQTSNSSSKTQLLGLPPPALELLERLS